MERRNTKQRQTILDSVRSRCDHPTAEQIYNQVKNLDGRISLGTVYRNLQLLAESGEILAVRIPNGPDRFDLTVRNHDHFICKKCGSVSDIVINTTDNNETFISKEGFIIDSKQTVFSGFCPECSKKVKNG